jgi:hypothetical protein
MLFHLALEFSHFGSQRVEAVEGGHFDR